MKPLGAGSLKHLVTILSSSVNDDFGKPTNFVQCLKIRVGVDQYRTTRSSLEAEDSQLNEIHLFCRHKTAINTKQRLVLKDVTYEIKKLENVELLNKRLNIHCVEIRK